MKLGIMQPYFFPYLGYFDLIHCADEWIVFDTPQYIRHGWVNRNRILHPSKDWQYVLAPLSKHPWNAAIKDVHVAPGREWRERILGQITHYRKRAPYFESTHDLVSRCLANEETSIARLNSEILGKVCLHLGIPYRHRFWSDLGIELDGVETAGDWALEIARALGATEYINPPGGAALFDRARFEQAGVTLTIRELPALEYTCRGREFIPHLSIIDVLMWNSPEAILAHLCRHAPGAGDAPSPAK